MPNSFLPFLPCPSNAQQSHWMLLGCAVAAWALLRQTSKSVTSILVISIPLGTPHLLLFQARKQRLGWLHRMGGFTWGWDLFRISREILVVNSRLVFLWWSAPGRITGWGQFVLCQWGSESSTDRAAMDSCQGRPVEVRAGAVLVLSFRPFWWQSKTQTRTTATIKVVFLHERMAVTVKMDDSPL